MTCLAFSPSNQKFLVISDNYIGSQQFINKDTAIERWHLGEYFPASMPSSSTGRMYRLDSSSMSVLIKRLGSSRWELYVNVIEILEDAPSAYEYW